MIPIVWCLGYQRVAAFEEYKKSFGKEYVEKTEHNKRHLEYHWNMRFIHSVNRQVGVRLLSMHKSELAKQDTIATQCSGLKRCGNCKKRGPC